MAFRTLRTLARIPVFCIGASLLGAGLSQFSLLSKLDAVFADHLKFSSKQAAQSGTVLVVVDEKSIQQTGKFPFDRSELAHALGFMKEAGAQRIYIDAGLGAVEDRNGDDALEAALQALGPERVALPVGRLTNSSEPDKLILPLQRFAQHATLAASQFIYDSDNRIRRITGLPESGHKLAADWLQSPTSAVRTQPLIIDYSYDLKSLPRISIADVSARRVSTSTFAGHNVIVGLQISAPQYTIAVPNFQRISRIEAVALAVETLAAMKSGPGLQGAQLTPLQTLLFLLVFTLCATAVLLSLPPLAGFVFAASAGLIWVAVIDNLQRLTGVWLPILSPALALLLLWQMLKFKGSPAGRIVARYKTKLLGAGQHSLVAAADLIGNPAAVFDHAGRLIHANDAFRAAGLAESRQAGPSDFAALAGQDIDTVTSSLHFARDSAGASAQYEVALRWVETLPGKLALASFKDVTETHRRESELSELAFRDKLTGLANRVAFHARLTTMSDRAAETPFGILIIDLDGFKQVNDTLGHHAGDELLAGVAQRIQGLLRAGDMAARLGGDEFAIIVASGHEDASVRVAKALLTALVEPFPVEGGMARVGASIGIALCPLHAADASQAIKLADAAMYAAKRNKPAYAVHSTGEIVAVKAA